MYTAYKLHYTSIYNVPLTPLIYTHTQRSYSLKGEQTEYTVANWKKNKNQTSRCTTCWNQHSKYGLHTHLEKDIHCFDVDFYRQSVLVSVWFGVILQLNEIHFPAHLLSHLEKSTTKHLALFVHCAMEICLLSSPVCRTRHGLEAFRQLSDENGDWSTILTAGLLASQNNCRVFISQFACTRKTTMSLMRLPKANLKLFK